MPTNEGRIFPPERAACPCSRAIASSHNSRSEDADREVDGGERTTSPARRGHGGPVPAGETERAGGGTGRAREDRGIARAAVLRSGPVTLVRAPRVSVAGCRTAPGRLAGANRRRWARRLGLPVAVAVVASAAGCGEPAAPPLEPEEARIPPAVLAPPPVPRPAPREPVQTYSVSVEDVPVRELLFALARDAGIDMDIDPGIDARVTMNATDAPLPLLLERISRQAALHIEVEDGTLVARRDEPVLRTYSIDYVPLARETRTVNEVGTGIGSGIETQGSDENGSNANVTGRTEHRFWDALVASVRGILGEGGSEGGGEDAGGISGREPGGSTSVFAHRETSLIAVRARASGHREVGLLLDHVLASARRQVLIEATIVEVDLDDRFRGGVDFSRVFGDFEIETSLLGGNLGTPPLARLSIPDLSLTVRLLSEFGNVRVLSTPLVMSLNNQTAIVKIAENRVFFTSEVRTESRETTVERNVRTNLHTIPVGLILLVTPSVAADDEIILKIRPTVTREVGFVVDPNPELAAAGVVSRIPEIAVREIESVLRLRSGEVAVLGGLMREESREEVAGVPLLSRLPGIGAAFRFQDRKQDKTELIVFLRPTVVRDPSLTEDLRKYRRWWPPAKRSLPADTTTSDTAPESASTRVPLRGADAPAGARIVRSWSAAPLDGILERAWAAFQRGDHRAARANYLEALDERPEEALAGLGATALRERRLGAARAWYARLAELVPDDRTARTMSILLGPAEEPAVLERELVRGMARTPAAPWLRIALGNLRARQGDWNAAADAYRAARRLAPSNPDAAYNLAVSSDRLARPLRALAEYRDALALAALSPPAFDVAAARERAVTLERRIEDRP